MRPVIKVENLSKLYRLGEVGTGTLSHDLNRWWARIRGKEDPFSKVGVVNDRAVNDGSKYAWALKDISFEVQQGEVLGIIGKNGAGKSTLLKILSRVTTPTEGDIRVKGRIASLLEVGTGFHPELTGRENIFLNGAILGMTKREIKSKFDEIVDFAGVAKYIDTPVKRYSSGMYVRLAFAVAAHLESEILIVDEVLAVGDAEFQKKCVGKMKDVSQAGRTVLFVSHNMGSVKNLCNRGLLLKDGTTEYAGTTDETIHRYILNRTNKGTRGIITSKMRTHNSGEAFFHKISMTDDDGLEVEDVLYRNEIRLSLELEVVEDIKDALIDIKVISEEGIIVAHSLNKMHHKSGHYLHKGNREVHVSIVNHLAPGNYSITAGIHASNGITIDYVEDVYPFTVLKVAKDEDSSYPFEWVHGYHHPEVSWELIQ